MFSGIVQAIGSVAAVERTGDEFRIAVDAPIFSERVYGVGDSIAIDGVCLTVIAGQDGPLKPPFRFDVGSETVRKTTLGELVVGSRVNVEPSLRIGDALDGHLVQGHVDCVTEVRAVAGEGNTFRVEIAIPPGIRALIAPKGAITVDGVSLTVGEVGAETFAVYVVPHTWSATKMSGYRVGTRVNIEADMIARYLERLLVAREVAR